MAFLNQIKSKGFDNEFQELIKSHLKEKTDKATYEELMNVIDQNGINSKETIASVGTLNAKGKFKPLFYKELRAFNIKISKSNGKAVKAGIEEIKEAKTVKEAPKETKPKGIEQVKIHKLVEKKRTEIEKKIEQRNKRLEERDRIVIQRKEKIIKKISTIAQSRDLYKKRIKLKELKQQRKDIRKRMEALTKNIKKRIDSITKDIKNLRKQRSEANKAKTNV